MIRLWTARSGYDGTAAFTTWLHRVVVNRCLNHRRAQRPTGELTESEATLRGRLARARLRLTSEMTPWAVEELAVAR